MAGFDEFGDILGDHEEGGIFTGSGHKAFETVKQSTQADGLRVELCCRSCGRPSAVTLEWPELFVIGTNGPNVPTLLPDGFQVSQANRSIYTTLNCTCGKPGLSVHTTPDEAARHVNTAIRMGYISPEQVEMLKQMVRAKRGG